MMCFNYVNSESSFFGDDEASIRSWLLREISGSHLRLTAFSVRHCRAYGTVRALLKRYIMIILNN